ncbi:hypothetical protein SDC9_138968 [bioreactor metagenome]|uniref:Uncharacterized protein n=1 Tax=bioreactor metagenome TaxID=1076179 RepID=A0A645DQU1_9ZZZZ
MLGPPQRDHTCRAGRVQVRLAGGDHPDGRRRTVLLVIGMQDQEHVQRMTDLGRCLIFLVGQREHHVQEVVDIAQIGAGIDDRLADARLVGGGRDGADLADQLGRVDLQGGVVSALNLRTLVGGQRVDHRRHDGHRMRVRREGLEMLHHRFVQRGRFGEQFGEMLAFIVGGQVPEDQQVRGFDETGMLRQRLDRNAAVPQDSVIAIDEGDLRGT